MDTTCHIQSLSGSFGGSLSIINGGLECPPDPSGYHAEAIVTRLRYYCIAASVIGVQRLMNFDGCDGLGDAFHNCVMVRTNSRLHRSRTRIIWTFLVHSRHYSFLCIIVIPHPPLPPRRAVHLEKTGYCPECQSWYVDPSTITTEETQTPVAEGPTQQPVIFRSWANDEWLQEITRGSSATRKRRSLLSPASILGILCLYRRA